MSAIGEGQGGFGRFFGGISRSQIAQAVPNFMFCPCLRTIGGAGFDYSANLQYVRINAAGEGVIFAFRVPEDAIILGRRLFLNIPVWDNVNPSSGLMNYSVLVDEAHGDPTATMDYQDTFDNLGSLIRIEFGVDHTNPANPGVVLHVALLYMAAGAGGVATNIDVGGAYFSWE
jgi:hypothetical protein